MEHGRVVELRPGSFFCQLLGTYFFKEGKKKRRKDGKKKIKEIVPRTQRDDGELR